MSRTHWIQTRLQANGFSPGAIDGVFGPDTRRAVRQFQAANHLKVDGVVGDRTWAALMAGPEVELPSSVYASAKAELAGLISDTVDANVRSVLLASIDTLGWREEPDGSNDGPKVGEISTGYFSVEDELKYGKPPWCALAVSYWLLKGLDVGSYSDIPFGRRLGAVAQIEDWAKPNGRFVQARASTTADVGAIFTMSRGGSGSDSSASVRAGHTGLIVADDGQFVVTVEGNTSNAVKTRRRRKTSLRGWVRWW